MNVKFKKLITTIVIIVASLFVLSFVRDLIIKSVVSAVVSQTTGTKVSIGSLSLGIIRQSVKVKNLRMYNPNGFSRRIMVDLPKAQVDFDIPAILRGKIHLRNLEVNLKELTLEKNKEGKLNVDSLKIAEKEDEKEEKKLPVQLDLVNLAMGRIVSKDYSVGKEPFVEVYDINFKKSYKNITSVEQLVALILTEPMKQAGIKGAKIYGAALLTGVGVVPITIASKFMASDSAAQNFNVNLNRLYDTSLKLMNRIGKVLKEDKSSKIIEAEVRGASIEIALKQISAGNTQINISARKLMLPKKEIASGVLYQIEEELKR